MMRIMLSELHAPLAALTRNYSIYGDRNDRRAAHAPLAAHQQNNEQQYRHCCQQA